MAQEEEGTQAAALGPGTLRGTRKWGLGRGPGHVGRENPWNRKPNAKYGESRGPHIRGEVGIRGRGPHAGREDRVLETRKLSHPTEMTGNWQNR